MKPIRKILIANRGEIARRIIRACRAMGIQSVAVYSDADRDSLMAREADESVAIGAAAVAESYLNIAKLLDAAKKTGADAIHPGYGFLSENAAFAEAVVKAGLVFVGPSAAAIRKMGEKIAAKELAAKAGVPTVPGYQGADQTTPKLAERAKAVGFPLLVKASAGGGGKGMRTVKAAGELTTALDAARREAERAFGKGDLLLERYLEGARHIEVQVLGDRHGNVVHLFERDCSLQRRHQKILEECPSPFVDEALRGKMCQAAVAAAKAIGYDNAGTVEFLVDKAGAFFFLEMNTRLQVEHPVTEFVTGLDLVRLQIEVAEGRPLPFGQEAVTRTGHAIEVRLCAEDPLADFAPETGVVTAWSVPEGPGLRVDAGIRVGDRIGIDYDPMLAKLIAHGRDRAEALRKLQWMLGRAVIQGVPTNRDFLLALTEDPEVVKGTASTSHVEAHFLAEYRKKAKAEHREAAVVAAMHLHLSAARRRTWLPSIPVGFRNNRYRHPQYELEVGGEKVTVSCWAEPDGRLCSEGFEARVVEQTSAGLRLELNGAQRDFAVSAEGETIHVAWRGGTYAVTRLPRFPRKEAAGASGVRAPMTGRVTRVYASAGKTVREGEPLLVLEAMKMEQTVHAKEGGKLAEILVKEGDTVERGVQLVRMEAH